MWITYRVSILSKWLPRIDCVRSVPKENLVQIWFLTNLSTLGRWKSWTGCYLQSSVSSHASPHQNRLFSSIQVKEVDARLAFSIWTLSGTGQILAFYWIERDFNWPAINLLHGVAVRQMEHQQQKLLNSITGDWRSERQTATHQPPDRCRR